ncbi:hypothetical protein O6H91_02G124200 [Diphasiastrum complanatum]|uniref:Uncharacterized protein n=1 Tax=Diphasiastrum complanatum TaxID=34168 RepID=A0ACC2EK42_DIPCM|nr:hypothetical protein O6H91_02G124200 [Diphasiastrum complanatum]
MSGICCFEPSLHKMTLDPFCSLHLREGTGLGSALMASALSWIGYRTCSEAEKKKELLKLTSKWHSSTKGTLVRRFRVSTKSEGRRLLNTICSLLSEDDSFRDASSHKGCQVRRENAHAESVCCNNVRALLDELPTPHLVIEITVFPRGPIAELHYEKAQKLEKVLRTGISI